MANNQKRETRNQKLDEPESGLPKFDAAPQLSRWLTTRRDNLMLLCMISLSSVRPWEGVTASMDDVRRARQREYNRRYYLAHRERQLEQNARSAQRWREKYPERYRPSQQRCRAQARELKGVLPRRPRLRECVVCREGKITNASSTRICRVSRTSLARSGSFPGGRPGWKTGLHRPAIPWQRALVQPAGRAEQINQGR